MFAPCGTKLQRSEKFEEVEIDGVKVDYFDAKHKVIHEIKKSDKVKAAHEWQLKYYIYVFERNGIDGCTSSNQISCRHIITKTIALTVDKLIQKSTNNSYFSTTFKGKNA